MAKQLRDILKAASDTIKGVRPSQTSPASLGKNPGVDYDPKAADEREFVAAHSVQKWDDPYGNPNYSKDINYALDSSKEHRHGNDLEKTKASYFAPVKESAPTKKAEAVRCNMTEAGVACPVHGMNECAEATKINEDDHQYIEVTSKTGAKRHVKVHPSKAYAALNQYKGQGNKARIVSKPPMKEEVECVNEGSGKHPSEDAVARSLKARGGDANYKSSATGSTHRVTSYTPNEYRSGMMKAKNLSDLLHTIDKKVDNKTPASGNMKFMKMESVEQVDEVLSKSASAGEWISDFVHSKNPKFAGKSKKERTKQALAAYYAKQRDESVKEDLAVPLLGSHDSEEAVDMVKTELKAIANKALHLTMNMPQGMHIEPWVQSKIAQAKEMVSSVHDYMIYGDHKENEDMADTSGASGGSAGGALVMNQMDTPLTFPNMSVDVNTGRNV